MTDAEKELAFSIYEDYKMIALAKRIMSILCEHACEKRKEETRTFFLEYEKNVSEVTLKRVCDFQERKYQLEKNNSE